MRRVMVILFVIILAAAFVLMKSGSLLAERGLPEGVLKIINDRLYKSSYWGILAKDLKSGEVICELNADKFFVPASTTKLFTMTAGLDTFGPDYRFQTPIYHRGEVDSQGTLYGDLILVASGDLTMGGRTIADERIAYTNMDHTEAGMDGVFEAILTRTDPVSFARTLLVEALERAGVKVEAAPSGVNPSYKLSKNGTYKETERVALLVSPPYGELVKLILKVSHNLGADMTPLLILPPVIYWCLEATRGESVKLCIQITRYV